MLRTRLLSKDIFLIANSITLLKELLSIIPGEILSTIVLKHGVL